MSTLQTLHGTYVGPLTHLRGWTALLRMLPDRQLVAQFDDIRAVRDLALLERYPQQAMALSLGFGWHAFDESEFHVDRECFAEQHSDAMVCKWCGLTWDVNDPAPPPCQRWYG